MNIDKELHQDFDIINDHMPRNQAEASYFKGIIRTLDFDDFYDILNIIRALASVMKVMAKIMVRNLSQQEINE